MVMHTKHSNWQSRKLLYCYYKYKLIRLYYINLFYSLREPEKVFEGLEITPEISEELLNNIKRRLTPQPIKIRAGLYFFFLTYYSYQ